MPALRLVEVSGVEARRAALVDFCAETLDLRESRLSLGHDALGAPLLLRDGAEFGWRVSSASRGLFALFGLSRENIGVDVEIFEHVAPAWNVLHERERAEVAALPRDAQAEAFLRLWIAKEAYLKALGLGLRREPGEIEVRAQEDAFLVLDRNEVVATRETRLWREGRAKALALCACVVL